MQDWVRNAAKAHDQAAGGNEQSGDVRNVQFKEQTEGRWNAIVPRDNDHELRNGAEASSRRRR